MALELSEKIKLLPGKNNGKYPYCHSLLIEDGLIALIDPASDPDFLKELANSKKVDVIILSHYHEDHFWFSHLFPSAQIWAPELDAPALESLERLLDEYQQTGEGRKQWRKILLDHFHYQPRRVSCLLKEGGQIFLGKTEIQVIHTPGHTPGHSCFYFPEPDLIYLSDIDLSKFGPWYGDRGSDIDAFIQSIKRISEFPAKTFVASHEQAIYQDSIKKESEQYLQVIEDRETKLRALLKEPRTIQEIIDARIIYKKPREPKSFYDFGEWAMMTKHLQRMMKRGEVIEDSGKYYLSL